MKTLAALLILVPWTSIQSQKVNPHPRGLLTVEEVKTVRVKVKTEPSLSMFTALKLSTELLSARKNKTPYDSSDLARCYAYLYILTGDTKNAEHAWKISAPLFRKTETLNNPFSRGLNRAKLLRDMAETYDLCGDAWTLEQCKEASEKIILNIMSTSSNMGYDANYAIESNWMGVRYGSVLYASLVCDDFNSEKEGKSRLQPFEWDAIKRLGDHMRANFNSNGWNTESLSYFAYNWTFVGPALVAMQNQFKGKNIQFIEPRSLNSLWAYSTASVAIRGIKGKVTQPDFSDDDPMSSYYLFPLGLRLFPETQKPALFWMMNYLSGPDTWTNDAEQLIYNIIWYPENLVAENPAMMGWLTYYDIDQGIALFRNRFQDGNDIVAGFTATARRVRGHQGYDNLGFRILGLGSIWAVGAGRTDQVAGQTSLFPTENIKTNSGEKGALGRVLNTRFDTDGSGLISATGSCMGVINHERTFRVDYSKKSGAEAVFIISDRSDNGRTWRMNSPEFNTLTIAKDGFKMVSPDGASMNATVFTDDTALVIRSEKIRYGGATEEHNLGVAYAGISYKYTNAIDCNTRGNITVVFTLQPKGLEHPVVSKQNNGLIKIGNQEFNR